MAAEQVSFSKSVWPQVPIQAANFLTDLYTRTSYNMAKFAARAVLHSPIVARNTKCLAHSPYPRMSNSPFGRIFDACSFCGTTHPQPTTHTLISEYDHLPLPPETPPTKSDVFAFIWPEPDAITLNA